MALTKNVGKLSKPLNMNGWLCVMLSGLSEFTLRKSIEWADKKEKLFERSEFFSFRLAILIFSECGAALIFWLLFHQGKSNETPSA